MKHINSRIADINKGIALYNEQVKAYGLSHQIPIEAEENSPARNMIIEYGNDSQELIPDDSYQVWCYHRQTASEEFKSNNRGEGNEYQITAPLKIVVHTSSPDAADSVMSILESMPDIVVTGRSFFSIAIINEEFGFLEKFDFQKFHIFEISYNLIYKRRC